MISVFFLLGAIALFIWWFKVTFEVPESPPVRGEFRAPLPVKGGFAIATISYPKTDELTVTTTIHRWAIRLENPKLPLDYALQVLLPQTTVISVALECPELPPIELPKPGSAERVMREMKTAEELLVAYCKEKEAIDPLLDQHSVGTVHNRSIKQCLVDIADQQIIRIVNPSGVTSPFRT